MMSVQAPVCGSRLNHADEHCELRTLNGGQNDLFIYDQGRGQPNEFYGMSDV